jgi:hypothetical protein
MREYFADLFAASYCGLSAGRPLELIASANPVSHTHPSTADRLQTIHDFVAGNAVPVASAFNLVLGRVGLPTLHVRFVEPQLESAFDAIRPASIASVDELHGIFSAGWRYLDDVRAGNRATWAGFGPEESTRIINDLIEKSIRNRQILEHWRDAASQ